MDSQPVRERPILFSGPMVRAILEGRKTQTRRVMQPQPSHDQHHVWRGKVTRDAEHRMWCWKYLVLENIWDFPDGEDRKELATHCPYGVPGDRLWVRETWRPETDWIDGTIATSADIRYSADGEDDRQNWVEIPEAQRSAATVMLAKSVDGQDGRRWHPSIHMPRWASRITLGITDVRVQRIQDISEQDALAEGVEFHGGLNAWRSYDLISQTPFIEKTAVGSFRTFWTSINAKKHPWSSNPWVWCLSFRTVA